MLVAELDNGALLAPGVQLDLVDCRRLAGVNELLQMLDPAAIATTQRSVSYDRIHRDSMYGGFDVLVAYADGDHLALGTQLLERLPQMLATLGARGWRVDQEAVHVACTITRRKHQYTTLRL